MTTGLGDKIKRLRLARDLTLKQVGARAGVSPTHLSEIERGKTSPTVGALVRIAEALGEEASRLIDEAPVCVVAVVRAGERRELVENGLAMHPLTGDVSRRELSVVEIVVPAGASSPLPGAVGEQFIVILEGTIDMVIASAHQTLKEGDAVHCAGDDCGGVHNRGDRSARLLWVASPPAVL